MSHAEKTIGSQSIEAMLAEVERAIPKQSDDGHTTRELAITWRCSENLVKQRLRVLSDAGLLWVGRRQTMRIDGRPNQAPVYRLLKKAKR